jgi:hypothetical protein
MTVTIVTCFEVSPTCGEWVRGESPGYAVAIVCETSVIKVEGAWLVGDSSGTGAAEVEAVDVSGASGVLVA